MRDALRKRAGSKNRLCRHVGFPPPGMDISLRRAGQWAVQEHGWRGPLDGDRTRQQPGTAGKTLRKNCAGSSSFKAKRGLRHDRIEAERAVSLRRRGQELEKDGCQPVYGVASVLFWQPDC